ncbi:hypothetical protein ACQ4PT_046381 [Festuca glaucescens]
MAEAAAWTAVFRQRVVSVHEHVRDARDRLVALDASFLQPLPGTGAQAKLAAFPARLDLLMGSLRAATPILNSALVYIEAAEILALHGGSANPWTPLPSVLNFTPRDAAVQLALARYQTARVWVLGALTMVECSRGHLATAIALFAANPAIPYRMPFVMKEYGTAHFALRDAVNMVEDALFEVTLSRQRITP